jgi:hypothetical protein
VFYATPSLDNLELFNAAYKAAQVHKRSVFFSPNDIGALLDDRDHSIAYREDSRVAFFCSEPREIGALDFEDIAGITQHDFEEQRYQTLERSARELRETARLVVTSGMRGAEQEVTQRVHARRELRPIDLSITPEAEQTIEDILVAREMVRVDLGLDVVIAQPRT